MLVRVPFILLISLKWFPQNLVLAHFLQSVSVLLPCYKALHTSLLPRRVSSPNSLLLLIGWAYSSCILLLDFCQFSTQIPAFTNFKTLSRQEIFSIKLRFEANKMLLIRRSSQSSSSFRTLKHCQKTGGIQDKLLQSIPKSSMISDRKTDTSNL